MMGFRLAKRVLASGLGLPESAEPTRAGRRVRGPVRDIRLRFLAHVLATCAHDQTGENVFPRVRTLAAQTGMHRTQVLALLRQLRDLGVLRVERPSRGWKATRYIFVADALPPHPEQDDDEKGSGGATEGEEEPGAETVAPPLPAGSSAPATSEAVEVAPPLGQPQDRGSAAATPRSSAPATSIGEPAVEPSTYPENHHVGEPPVGLAAAHARRSEQDDDEPSGDEDV